MKYKEIEKLIKDTFPESDELTARKENGRIIVYMKRDSKVWTKEQEKYLVDMENRIINNSNDNFTKLFELLKDHIKQGHK